MYRRARPGTDGHSGSSLNDNRSPVHISWACNSEIVWSGFFTAMNVSPFTKGATNYEGCVRPTYSQALISCCAGATAAARLVARRATRDFGRATNGIIMKKKKKIAIRRRGKKARPFFLFAVVDKNKLAHFAIRRKLLLVLFFRHFLLFAVAENKVKGAFRYSLQ